MTNRRSQAGIVLALLIFAAPAVLASRAWAEDAVGWVSALEGTAEVLRASGGDWAPLAPADALAQGDQVRTQADSRMKILLRDDSVLTLGESSQLRLDEQVAGAAPQSTFSLFVGRIRAIATERYGAAGARFEVKTPTAVAGVRGTEFVAQHDTTEEETLVAGIVDTTMVRAAIDTSGARAVRVGPGEVTRIRRGSYPSAAAKIPADQLRGLLDATAVKNATAGGTKSGRSESQAEPRLPTRPGDRAGSPVERVVDNPLAGEKGPKHPAPPPPPPPGN